MRTTAAPGRRALRTLLEAHGYHVADEGEDGLIVEDAEPAAAGREPDDADLEGVEPLTPREREVLTLVAQGLSNRAIAARLGTSPHTVKTHVSSIYGKLGAANRAEAVRQGIRLGLLEV